MIVMKKVNFESVLKRILSTSYVAGTSGGLFISAMRSLESSKSVLILIIQLFVTIFLGTVIGALARKLKLKRLMKASAANEEPELKIADQKSFFIALVIMIIAHFINADMNEWNQFTAVLLTGGIFILSMVNGHLDISSYSGKSLLSLGIIPIILGFILGYSGHDNQGVINSVWIFGFMGFLSFLLILSNSQLNFQLFSSKHINVANRKRIKIFNFSIVLIFFIFCVIVINFRRIIMFTGEVIKSIINFVYKGVEGFTIWLLNNPKAGRVPDEADRELSEFSFGAGQSTLFDTIVLVILALVLIIVISVIVIIIKKQKLAGQKPVIMDQDEFNENIEIIKERLHLNLRKKFTYTLKGFDDIKDVGGKTRYLYGFIIERLYYKKVRITISDTPDDIMHKVFKCDNGQLLEKLGFEELTEKYRRVRYGGKKVKFDGDLGRMAEAYERVIKNINDDAIENKDTDDIHFTDYT